MQGFLEAKISQIIRSSAQTTVVGRIFRTVETTGSDGNAAWDRMEIASFSRDYEGCLLDEDIEKKLFAEAKAENQRKNLKYKDADILVKLRDK